ncbi:MAG: hypothetical protein HOH92_09915, partial [Crocinitomicaceae bacterium]|nr:hypothetical protein [Crocinitomicaceae bacterium]
MSKAKTWSLLVCMILMMQSQIFAQTVAQVSLEAPNVEQLWTRAFWHEEHTGKTMQG